MTGTADTDRGFVRIACTHSVTATTDKLEELLKQRDVKIFARIDFAHDAAAAGLDMRPQQLLIFGNPKAGTPLLQAQPTVGLDLPLRALVWEDTRGATWLAYTDPRYIVDRHGVPGNLSANLAAVIALLEQAARG